MSDNKKYYYLKLKDNFYNTDEMKVLEAMPNGYEYSSFYLKICLMSLKEEGRLIFKGRIPYNAQLLSTITGHNIDVIKSALDTLQQLEMISLLDSGTMYINDIQALIGKGSSEAERKQLYRNRIEQENQQIELHPGQCPDICPPELELELEFREKEKLSPLSVKDTPFYLTKKKKKLTGKRLESFERFWSAFNYKKSKAEAADSWLEIPELTDSMVEIICNAAKIESTSREELISGGGTPKMAQGWISSRRWEDEIQGPAINNQDAWKAAL